MKARPQQITNSQLMKNKAKKYNDMNILDQSTSSEINTDKFRVTSNKNANSAINKISENQENNNNYMKQTLRSAQGIQAGTGRTQQNQKQNYTIKSNSNSNQKNQTVTTSNRMNVKVSQSSTESPNQQGKNLIQNQNANQQDKYNKKTVSKSSDLKNELYYKSSKEINSYIDDSETNKTNQSNFSKSNGNGGNIINFIIHLKNFFLFS